MVRLSVGALAALALMGCNGLIDGGGEQRSPRSSRWPSAPGTKAWPVLDDVLPGLPRGHRAGVEFLAGANPMAVRDTLLGFDRPGRQPRRTRVVAAC